jgi:hypothetical protein
VVGVADDGVFGILAGGRMAVMVAEEMVVAVELRFRHRLHPSILEENVMDSVGIIAASLTAGVGGVGHDRMVAAMECPKGGSGVASTCAVTSTVEPAPATASPPGAG